MSLKIAMLSTKMIDLKADFKCQSSRSRSAKRVIGNFKSFKLNLITCSMVLHVPLPYDHGRDSALRVQGPCPWAGGLGGPSAPPREAGGCGGLQAPHLLACESTSRNAAMHSHALQDAVWLPLTPSLLVLPLSCLLVVLVLFRVMVDIKITLSK